jgi:NADH dehydrogenase
MPSWERKIRVIVGWVNNFFLGRDIVSLSAVQNPRGAFVEFAARPKPLAEAPAPAAVAAKAPRAKAPRAPRKVAAKAVTAPEVAVQAAPAAEELTGNASEQVAERVSAK